MTTVLSFMRRYMARYWAWYLGGIVALVATNWLSVSIPVVLAEAIDQFGRDHSGIGHKALLIALMGLGIICVRTASRILFFTPGRLIEAQLKDDMFSRLLEQQPPFYRRFATGDLISRFSSDISALRLISGFASLQIVNVVAVLSLSLTQMARISPRLTSWMIVPLAIALTINQLFIRKLFYLVKRMQIELGALSDHVLSSYEGVATVQSLGAEGSFLGRFRERNDAYMHTMLQRANLRTLVGPLLYLAIALNVFLLLFVGGPMAIRGEISVGELVAFTTLVALMTSPARGLGFLFAIVKQSQASLERLDEVMSPEPDRPDRTTRRPAPQLAPRLEIRDLDFRYAGASESTLHGVSLRIEAGTTLGILGPTGAGKSTLLRCIARLENPPAGTVLVDGVDVREIELEAWRSAMVLVPQRPFLFSESLADNILLAERDDAKLAQVLRLAALEPDVAALPNGENSLVGEAGLMLSGGQRQRTGLARGLVRRPQLLILDDVLSAVDHTTEKQLIATLQGSQTRPTTIIVAHRISALQHAEQIAVIEDGVVRDIGSHDELIGRPGFYRDTWERQTEHERGDA